MDHHLNLSIPMSSPDVTAAEREAVMSVLNSSSLSMGPYLQSFEEAFCRRTGSRHAIAVNAGTSGLHLCVCAAGVRAGDYVITTPFSFIASTNAILFERAIPVFVDAEPRTGNIDVRQVREAARDLLQGGKAAERWLPRNVNSNGTLKAILPVHVFGQPADMDGIQQIAQEHNLKVIEDSCEALGAEYKGRSAGTLGDYGVFAFYPNKQITTGEGGMVVTDDEQAARTMRALRNQGRSTGDTWLQHTLLGFNYRLDEMSAALGTVQMSRLDELLAARQQVAQWYGRYLDGIPGVEAPHLEPDTTQISWFIYVTRLAAGLDRQKVAEYLSQLGIPVRPYFAPIHLQPYMVERFGYRAGNFPVTEDLGMRGLALPFSGKMTEGQVQTVCQVLKEAVSR